MLDIKCPEYCYFTFLKPFWFVFIQMSTITLTNVSETNSPNLMRFCILYYVLFLVPGLNKVARKLDIDCAPAMVGWDQHCGFSHPLWVKQFRFNCILSLNPLLPIEGYIATNLLQVVNNVE